MEKIKRCRFPRKRNAPIDRKEGNKIMNPTVQMVQTGKCEKCDKKATYIWTIAQRVKGYCAEHAPGIERQTLKGKS